MQILFRVDASFEIGNGHVMRCLTMANELKQRGCDCKFICRDHPGHLNSLIRNSGFLVYNLPASGATPPINTLTTAHSAYDSWLGITQDRDAAECLSIVKNWRPDLLIVDHYALDAVWESQLKCYIENIVVIDDLANRAHDCSLLLDQNPGRHANDYLGLTPKTCSVWAGPEYALLRPEFAKQRAKSLARRRNMPYPMHLLISLGGVDRGNQTSGVLKAVRQSNLAPECQITVVMGPNAMWLTEVQQEVLDFRWPTEVKVNVQCMASLMATSDLAIGTAGTTALERCCMGLPALVVLAAENQVPGANALASIGAIELLDYNDTEIPNFIRALSQCSRPANLSKMQRSCAQVTDGTGAELLALELIRGRF